MAGDQRQHDRLSRRMLHGTQTAYAIPVWRGSVRPIPRYLPQPGGSHLARAVAGLCAGGKGDQARRLQNPGAGTEKGATGTGSAACVVMWRGICPSSFCSRE